MNCLNLARLLRSVTVLPLAIVLLATACTFGPVSTEKPVFTAEDTSSPQWLSDSYAFSNPDDGRQLYLRSVETKTGRALELFLPTDNEMTKKGFPWSLWWFPAEFIALDDGYYAVHLLYEYRMRYFDGGEPDFRHGYWIVKHDDNTLRVMDVESVEKEERRRLTEARALEITNEGELSGALSPATLRGFLSDLAAAADRAPAVSADGERKKDEKQLAKVLLVPSGVDSAAYDYLAAFHSLLPAAAVRDDPDLGDYLAYLEALAADGVAQGAYMLSRLYANGWGVAQDFAKARTMAHAAVASGYERANTVLGVLAFNGFGEPADMVRGLSLLERGAAAGDPRAMLTLSNLHQAGTGVEQNEATALSWLTKAADAELPEAQFELGRRYFGGEGVAQDDAAAFKLFESAAKLEHPDALAYLGFMYAKGRGVEANEETASQKFLKAAQLGQGWAQWQIGERLVAGTGIATDRAAGIRWLRQAAENGQAEAAAALTRLGEGGAPSQQATSSSQTGQQGAGAEGGGQGKPSAGALQDLEELADLLDEEAWLEAERARIEAELREMCAGRLCLKAKDGQEVYQTLDGRFWYYEDGRLAPESVWPER